MTHPLKIAQLYQPCDPKNFSFKSTAELEALEQPIGQENALDAVDFAANIQQSGYNLYAMGPSGSGKYSTIMSFLQKKAEGEKTPSDWCYVNNFKDPRKPLAIELPSGQAPKLKNDIYELIELLKVVLPAVFDSNEYHHGQESINQRYLDLQTDIFVHLEEEAKKHDVSMKTSSTSQITFLPVINGKILSAEEFKALAGKEKEEINRKLGEFELIVKEGLRQVSSLNKAQQKEFKAFDSKIANEAVESIIEDIRKKYIDSEKSSTI